MVSTRSLRSLLNQRRGRTALAAQPAAGPDGARCATSGGAGLRSLLNQRRRRAAYMRAP
ncbi:hypothetical protein [Nocardioides alpinus]|uniref:hypothetical protein n=1 Tax=Nocardioides alpinus TaxID=748909 RepID=UPI0012FEED5D|nr:hypothetical protein [Nocardioides alpinus]